MKPVQSVSFTLQYMPHDALIYLASVAALEIDYYAHDCGALSQEDHEQMRYQFDIILAELNARKIEYEDRVICPEHY